MLLLFLSVFLLSFKVGRAAVEGDLCTLCSCLNGNLDCSRRELATHFDDKLWTGKNFTFVDFEHNNIIHLRPFPIATIKKLSFRYNGISKIDDSSFRFINDLEELDFSYNHLTTLELQPNAFQGSYSTDGYEPLKNLRILSLNGNSIHSLHRDLFEHLPNLEVLNLAFNPFNVIDKPTVIAISSAYLLKSLDLTSTKISVIPATMLHTPRLLKTLNISNNNFNEIPVAIGEAQSLETLVVDGNPIEEIKSVPKIPTLKTVHINSMPLLTKIGKRSLSNFINLNVISCSYNPHLQYIDENALSSNQTDGETWPPIKEVYLKNNKLGYLDQYFINRLDLVEKWDLSMNPWVCDCKNQWFLSRLLPAMNKSQPDHAENLICHEPSEMRGLSLLVLSKDKHEMRCLDAYGNHPEKDALMLVMVFITVLICIPFIIFIITFYTKKLRRPVPFSRFTYQRTESLETFP